MLKSSGQAAALDSPCDDVRRQVFDACDGELPAAALAQMHAHVEQCDACRQRVETDAVFLRVVRTAATIDVAPAAFRERLLQSFQTRTTENAPA